MSELFCCPSCKYTEKQHNENKKRWNETTNEAYDWDNWCPEVFRDRLFSTWVVQCQNCGMSIIFSVSTKDEAIILWNELLR